MNVRILIVFLSLPLLSACTPTVKLEAPEKPIEINLNVNVKLEIQKDVKQAIAKNKDIF
jgi:hypothetical protein